MTKQTSKWESAPFFGWDGEGVTVGGAHKYVLLRTSAGDVLEDGDGLESERILAFVSTILAREPHAIHVGYGFSYDVNMFLSTAPRDAIQALWAGYRFRWGGFRMAYRARKSFELHHILWNPDVLKWEARGGTIWDVLGFFQATFVEALREYAVTDDATLDMLARMKAQRSTFHRSQLPEINKYCALELELLVRLMDRLREYLKTAGLKVGRWDGAGAVASALLTREGVKACLGPREHDYLAPRLARAVRSAYAGGRIECLKFGHTVKPVYHADVRSAYPFACLELPCVAHGTWAPMQEPAGFALAHVRWRFDSGAQAYPFFWRAWDGSIYFPPTGEGYYWLPEITVARDALAAGLLKGSIEIVRAWGWQQECEHKPFEFIPRLFDQRREWKQKGIGAERALKLGLNSLYGKTAQQVGGSSAKPPPFHQLEWAGWITASTRARLYRAALPALMKRSVIMFATDGIYSRSPLDLPDTGALGSWEVQTHEGITVVQSGVYWLEQGDDGPLYCRGFDRPGRGQAGALTRSAILEAWARGESRYAATLTRFVTMGQALSGGDAWARWRTWSTEPRLLSLYPETGKRELIRRGQPWRALVDTAAREPAGMRQPYGPNCSSPIPLAWEDTPLSELRRANMADDESDAASE